MLNYNGSEDDERVFDNFLEDDEPQEEACADSVSGYKGPPIRSSFKGNQMLEQFDSHILGISLKSGKNKSDVDSYNVVFRITSEKRLSLPMSRMVIYRVSLG